MEGVRWSGVPAQTAREQIHGLMMASHNRCGASSPARHFVSLPTLATLPLWDWCLRDTEVVFGITVGLPQKSTMCYFTFGVSCALMGVTREIKLHNCWPWDKFPRGPIPISPSHVVLTESITADLVQNSLLNVMTQQRQLMLSGKRFGVTSAQSSNNKWWVRCDSDGTLAIASLIRIMGNAGNDIEKVKVVEISMEFPKVPELKCASVSFSMKTPNELVLVMHDSARTRNILAVVDVERTFTSNKLAILSIITCLATARGSIATSCVCMTKSTGQRSLFVKGHYLATGRATVYEVVGEPDGEMVPISNHVGGLSQLSSSLFCIAKSGGCVAEIWDCHNTSSPLKVIEAMPQSSLLALVLAHPEVTFQKSQTSYKNNSIEVFVAASKIGTLLFPSQTRIEMQRSSLSASIWGVLSSLHARKQLHAFAMASHNRCGVSSPARHFVSLTSSPLWDWCLHDTEVVYGVVVALQETNCLCYFTFGVSCALMGVTRSIKLHNCWPWKRVLPRPIPISPSHVVLTESTRNTFRYSLVNVVTQQKQLMLTTTHAVGETSTQSSNNKWWVHYDNDGRLTVASLAKIMGGCGGSIEKVGIVVETEAELTCAAIAFSRGIPNEAVLVLRDPGKKSNLLVVIDVEKTYTTKKLAVLSFTKCNTTPGSIAYCIFMMKSTAGQQQRALFVKNFDSPNCASVYEVTESLGEMVKISRNAETLAQLSSSLFSITKIGGSAEIWDCNNTSAPVRVINARLLSELTAMAFPEFIFHQFTLELPDQKYFIRISAASTGMKVGILSLPSEIRFFDVFALS